METEKGPPSPPSDDVAEPGAPPTPKDKLKAAVGEDEAAAAAPRAEPATAPPVSARVSGTMAAATSGRASMLLPAVAVNSPLSPEAIERRKQTQPALDEAKGAESTGDWEKARAAMSRAIDSCPREPDFHALMGWYSFKCPRLSSTERDRLAKHHLDYALELNPSEPHAHYYYGLYYLAQGNLPRGRRSLDNALRTSPDFKLARDAIDKLEKRGGPTPSLIGLPRAGAARSGNARTRIVWMAFILLVLVGGSFGYQAATSRRPALNAFAKELGMTIPLSDMSQGNGIILLDVGVRWETMSQAERDSEMALISEGARRLKAKVVSVYSLGHLVGEVTEGSVCASATCLPKDLL